MDWYLDTAQAHTVAELQRDIGRYLRRHAADPATVPDAEVAVSELLGNVVRHAAGPAWVSLVWSGRQPALTVCDLGSGFLLKPTLPEDPMATGGRGLYIASHLAERLQAAARDAGGARVSAILPVARTDEETYDPPRHRGSALPTLDEARPGEGFAKEPFLRALVVQLAQTVEDVDGPGGAQAMVAQVGADVGGQFEAEYRLAHDVVGRMTPEQMADCYVRLKRAIDGDFSAVEVSPQRIVLVNTRCPFGEAVRRAPALCRMTSSVFGGIAARNSDREAFVVLEERIAVGDPRCRVVVHLDSQPEEPAVAHRYRADIAAR